MITTARGLALAVAVATVGPCTDGPDYCEEVPGEMPDLDMLVGDTVETEVWTNCLRDLLLGFGAESADSAAVAVSVTAADSSIMLTTVAIDVADSVRVTVWWADRYSDHVHGFHVRVR